VNLVTLFYVGGDKGLIRHKAIVCAYAPRRQGLLPLAVRVPLIVRARRSNGCHNQSDPLPHNQSPAWPSSLY
jgi:hypothetical protein